MNLKQKELLKIEKEMKKNYVKGMLFCILQDDNSIFTNQIFSSESEAEDYAIRCNNKRKKIKFNVVPYKRKYFRSYKAA